MESDSDGSSNMNGGDHLEEENTDGSDEENSIGSDDDDDDSIILGDLNARGFYDTLVMEMLRVDECKSLPFWHRRAIAIVLENVDEFCTAVAHAKGIHSISIGDYQGDDAIGPKLDITDETATSWNKIFQTYASIRSARELAIGGYNLGPKIMTRIVQVMQCVDELEFYFPWRTVSGEDMRPFVEAVSNHSSRDVFLCLSDDTEHLVESPFGEPLNHFEDSSILSQLVRLEALKTLWMHEIQLTFDECKAFGEVLMADTCHVETFRLENCSFANDECVSLIGNALASNRTIKKLVLSIVRQGQSFHDAMAFYISRSTSIVTFILESESTYDGVILLPERGDKINVACLIRTIARQNTTIKDLVFDGASYKLPAKDIQEIQQDVQQNYSLQLIRIGHGQPFRAVNRLNACGRSYLQEDATSNSKCIAVLAKVKNELDCLYYHLRENPVLCLTYCSAQSKLSGANKRKACDSDST